MLPYRQLHAALGLTETSADTLADARTGENCRHRLAGLRLQSLFGRLAGYEDVVGNPWLRLLTAPVAL